MSFEDDCHCRAQNDAGIEGPVLRAQSEARAKLAKPIAKYLDRRAAFLHAQPPDIPDIIPTSAGAALNGVVSRFTAESNAIAEEGAAAARAERGFALRHNETAPVAPRDPIFTFCLMVVVVFGETVISAGPFYNTGFVPTFTAALQLAGVFAFANVLLSAVMGFYGIRNLSYGAKAPDASNPRFVRRRIGALLVVVGISGALAWAHLSAGLVRTQGRLFDLEHGLAAYWDLLTTPEALLLSLTQVGFSALAAAKGFSGFADTLPERAHFAAQKAEFKDTLADLAADARDEVDDILADAEALVEMHCDALDAFNTSQRKSHASMCKAHRDLESALDTWEVRNRTVIVPMAAQHRDTNPDNPRQLSEDELRSLLDLRSALDVPPLPKLTAIPFRCVLDPDPRPLAAAALEAIEDQYARATHRLENRHHD